MDGTEDIGAELPFRTEDLTHMRVRVLALRLPKAFGAYILRLEWRQQGADEWHADPARWPLVIEEAAPVPPSVPEAP